MSNVRHSYLTDLTEQEWQLLKPLLPSPNYLGNPRQVDLGEILDAIFSDTLLYDADGDWTSGNTTIVANTNSVTGLTASNFAFV